MLDRYSLGRLMGFRRHRAGAKQNLANYGAGVLARPGANHWHDRNRRHAAGLFRLVLRLREMAGRLSPRQVAQYPLLLSAGSVFWQGVFAIASFLITVTLFVVVYRFMPKAEVTLRDTLPGAIIGGLLWETAKYVFAWSLNYFHYDQIYGSVGAVVAVLTWSYVSSLILLFGAQLTAVFHREHPHYPNPIPVPLPQ